MPEPQSANDLHVITAKLSDSEPFRWVWTCSCRQISFYSYPSKENALKGGHVHRALQAIR